MTNSGGMHTSSSPARKTGDRDSEHSPDPPHVRNLALVRRRAKMIRRCFGEDAGSVVLSFVRGCAFLRHEGSTREYGFGDWELHVGRGFLEEQHAHVSWTGGGLHFFFAATHHGDLRLHSIDDVTVGNLVKYSVAYDTFDVHMDGASFWAKGGHCSYEGNTREFVLELLSRNLLERTN